MTYPADDDDAPARSALFLTDHQRLIQAYSYAICRDFHIAEDVFQEVAMALLAPGVQPPPGERFLPWLKGMIRYKTLAAIAQRRRTPLLSADVLELIEVEFTLPVDGDAELRERLSACLDRLSEDARAVIQARYLDGLNCEAIAGRIGRSVQGVYALLKRARLTLIACVERGGSAA